MLKNTNFLSKKHTILVKNKPISAEATLKTIPSPDVHNSYWRITKYHQKHPVISVTKQTYNSGQQILISCQKTRNNLKDNPFVLKMTYSCQKKSIVSQKYLILPHKTTKFLANITNSDLKMLKHAKKYPLLVKNTIILPKNKHFSAN